MIIQYTELKKRMLRRELRNQMAKAANSIFIEAELGRKLAALVELMDKKDRGEHGNGVFRIDSPSDSI